MSRKTMEETDSEKSESSEDRLWEVRLRNKRAGKRDLKRVLHQIHNDWSEVSIKGVKYCNPTAWGMTDTVRDESVKWAVWEKLWIEECCGATEYTESAAVLIIESGTNR